MPLQFDRLELDVSSVFHEYHRPLNFPGVSRYFAGLGDLVCHSDACDLVRMTLPKFHQLLQS